MIRASQPCHLRRCPAKPAKPARARRVAAALAAAAAVVASLGIAVGPAVAEPSGWRVSAAAGAGTGVDVNRDVERQEVAVGGALRLGEALSLGAELTGIRFAGTRDERDAAARGVAVLPRVAWHFVRAADSSLSLELGLGGALFSRPFPPGGTRLNGYSMIGLGGELALGGRLWATAGLRLLHHSNGQGLVEDNPAFDGVVGTVGLALRLTAPSREGEGSGGASAAASGEGRSSGGAAVRLLEVRAYGGLHSSGYSTLDGGTEAFFATRASVGAQLGVHWRLRLDGLVGQFSSGSATAAGALRAYYRDRRGALGVSAGGAWLEGGITSETFAVHLERYEASWLTATSSLGVERRSFGDDLRFAELMLRAYPSEAWLVAPGFSYAVSSFKQTRADIVLRVERSLGALGGMSPALYAQWGGNLYTKVAVGVAFTFDGLSRRERERRDGLFSARFD